MSKNWYESSHDEKASALVVGSFGLVRFFLGHRGYKRPDDVWSVLLVSPMMDIRFRSLPKWNRIPDLERRISAFKTPYTRTLDKLEHEIRHLKGSDIRIEVGYRLDQIRNDGWPKVSEKPAHPGVVLYFTSATGALCFPCGTYRRMEDNIHAVALTLECLRAVDRYGVTRGNEQYLGFASLPAPMSVEEAAIAIVSYLPLQSTVPKEFLISSPDSFKNAYRTITKVLHPDHGGDAGEWHEFQRAVHVLEAHHGAEVPAA